MTPEALISGLLIVAFGFVAIDIAGLFWQRHRPALSPETTEKRPGADLTPAERSELTAALYRDVVAEAYAQVEDWFDAAPEHRDGYLVEDRALQLAVGEEVGRDGIQWSSGQPGNLEPTQSYRVATAIGQRGSPGTFQKLAKDPTWNDNYTTILEGLHSGTLKVRMSERVAEKDRELAAEQHAAIRDRVLDLCTNQFKREWAKSLNDGFALWERVGFPLERCAYRRAFTLDAWLLDDREQNWEGCSFKTAGTEGQTYDLPAENLVLYSHRRTGMNLAGEADLRFAAPHILITQKLIRLDAQACSAHGLGWRVIETDKDMQDAGDDAKIVSVLSAGRAEDNPTLKLAPGRKLVWIGPNGVLPDFESRITYHQAQIEKALGARASTLEKSTYANADLIDRVDRRTVRYYGALFASFVTEVLIPVVGEDLFGDDLVTPTPVCEYDLSADAQSAAVLVQLIQTGVITPTPEDEDVIRRQHGLPPRTSSTATEEPAEPTEQPETTEHLSERLDELVIELAAVKEQLERRREVPRAAA